MRTTSNTWVSISMTSLEVTIVRPVGGGLEVLGLNGVRVRLRGGGRLGFLIRLVLFSICVCHDLRAILGLVMWSFGVACMDEKDLLMSRTAPQGLPIPEL